MSSDIGKRICEFADSDTVIEMGEPENPLSWIKGKVWAEDVPADKFLLAKTVRLYFNDKTHTVSIVPYGILDVVEKSFIDQNYPKIAGFLKEGYATDQFSSITKYYILTYFVGVLTGIQFMQKLHIDVSDCMDYFSELNERTNFGGLLIDREKLKAVKPDDILRNLTEKFSPKSKAQILEYNKDSRELNVHMENALNNTEEDKVVDRFLFKSSLKDQEDWENSRLGTGEKPQKRLAGYSVSLLWKALEKFQLSVTEKANYILSTLDLGRGSLILPCDRINESSEIYELAIHAGEQSYKYLEKKYFIYFYGAYVIQRDWEKGKGNESKEVMLEKFHQIYIDSFGQGSDEEFEKIRGYDLVGDYEDVLLKDAFACKDREKLRKAISLAEKILNGNDNNGNSKINGQNKSGVSG